MFRASDNHSSFSSNSSIFSRLRKPQHFIKSVEFTARSSPNPVMSYYYWNIKIIGLKDCTVWEQNNSLFFKEVQKGLLKTPARWGKPDKKLRFDWSENLLLMDFALFVEQISLSCLAEGQKSCFLEFLVGYSTLGPAFCKPSVWYPGARERSPWAHSLTRPSFLQHCYLPEIPAASINGPSSL